MSQGNGLEIRICLSKQIKAGFIHNQTPWSIFWHFFLNGLLDFGPLWNVWIGVSGAQHSELMVYRIGWYGLKPLDCDIHTIYIYIYVCVCVCQQAIWYLYSRNMYMHVLKHARLCGELGRSSRITPLGMFIGSMFVYMHAVYEFLRWQINKKWSRGDDGRFPSCGPFY